MFVKLAHRRSFASSRRAFFIFSRAVFRVSLQLTERLEEAAKSTNLKENTGQVKSVFVIRAAL